MGNESTGSHGYVVPLVVSAAGYERQDKPVEIALDLDRLAREAGVSDAIDGAAVRVVEVDAEGRLIDRDVPCQFEADTGDSGAGELVFLLKGRTGANASRFFRVLIATAARTRPTRPESDLVRVADGVEDEGQECFRVVTPTATYLYQKQGAGFSSLLDRDGVDWINHHPTGGSAGSYRGIPNLGECGHPGYDNAHSRLASAGPLRARILSETTDGRWAFSWDIFPQYARLTLRRAGGKYWFLYEGTPGGRLDEEDDYCFRSPGIRTPASEIWTGDLPEPEWVYFGSGNTTRVLYLIHHEDDDLPDQYWPMESNMTVFGFGRVYRTIDRYMERTPAHFTIGFSETGDLKATRRTMDNAFRDLGIEVGTLRAMRTDEIC